MNLELLLQEDERLMGCASKDIVAQLPKRLSHGILQWAEKSPDQIAIVGEHQRFTYSELAVSVHESKAILVEHGMRPGDRVMLICENGPMLMSVFLAISELDGIAAVINARLSDREINLIAADCEPRLIICMSDESPDAKAHGLRLQATAVQMTFGEIMLSAAAPVDAEVVYDDAADQVLAMIYTTGTTGTPKGVMLTHRNLTFIAFVSGKLRGVLEGDHVYCALPMSHVFGLSAVSSSVLFSGGCIHLVPRFSAEKALEAIQGEEIAGFLGVPTMYAMMLEKFPESWLAPKLRFMYSGGAPLDPSLKKRVEDSFGIPLNNGYGLTETGPTICQTRQVAPLDNCSVGFQLPSVAIKIMGQHGRQVAQGEVGELWVKGPNIMKGYFRQPEATAKVLREGWFNTEDLVFQDELGAVNIAGRSKELIIRSGFNVYPPEVEAVLSAHDKVSLCAVIGELIDGDEEIVAFVQPASGATIEIAELLKFARDNLVGYKVPTRVVLMESLPAASSGKILKHQLKGLVV